MHQRNTFSTLKLISTHIYHVHLLFSLSQSVHSLFSSNQPLLLLPFSYKLSSFITNFFSISFFSWEDFKFSLFIHCVIVYSIFILFYYLCLYIDVLLLWWKYTHKILDKLIWFGLFLCFVAFNSIKLYTNFQDFGLLQLRNFELLFSFTIFDLVVIISVGLICENLIM